MIKSARPGRDYPLGENAVVFSWRTAALLPPLRRLISMRIGCSVPVWALPRISDRHQPKSVPAMSLSRFSLLLPYDQALVLLPLSNDAPSSRGQSEGDALQSPAVQIVVPTQSMPCCDMPVQGLTRVAAIQANHIVVAHRLPHRHRGTENFLGLNGLCKLTEGSMYQCDEV